MPIKCVDFKLCVHKRSKCAVCKMDQVQIGNDHVKLKNFQSVNDLYEIIISQAKTQLNVKTTKEEILKGRKRH